MSDITIKEIYVADEFSDTLTTVKKSKGDNSAEVFRDTLLIPALQNYEEVVLIFTHVKDLSRAFIHEAFSKLAMKGCDTDDIETKLQIVSPNSKWTEYIWNSLEENYKGV